ncbi:MAG: XRE family transcriptional regulator [Alicyclobacillus sp.]|uniref:helix-turn-helix domain-containing protein n=1 Tax=Alicyclobacillus herbarius TaxID=122960 RepID=UPI0004257991|nr:XRE family transcriptional regulator [Alicyclobacillus herbarius]MCL6445252.1 XRE family transcriptional regulator [Alicyclobacillus sp.]
MEFGTNVKRMRKQKGLTLGQLSEKSGVSRSMLSQIERGEKNPTIQVACQIAEALDTTLSELLGEHERRETIVIRKGQRLVYRDESSGFERHLLSPAFPSKGVEFILNIVPPGKESGTFPAHRAGVKEFIVIAKGKLRVVIGDTEMTIELAEGDSMYFEADVSHRFINVGDEECQYYLVIDSHEA